MNPFSGKNDDGSYGRSLKHLRLHPELRYWFCETFNGHFLGVHTPYLLYNVAISNGWVQRASVTRMGRGSRYQLWILVAAASPLELGGHGGRGLSVLEVGQVSLRELRPQARRDQEALLRAYAGGDQSHLPILIDGGTENEESTRMDDTWDRLFGRLCGYYDSRTGAADGYRHRREGAVGGACGRVA